MPNVFESGANILLQHLWHICIGVPPRGGQGGNCPKSAGIELIIKYGIKSSRIYLSFRGQKSDHA